VKLATLNRKQKTQGAYTSLSDLIAWQASAKRLNIAKRKQALRRSAGPYKAPTRGRGMEFEDVRQYQAGDDIRHIDWRVTARVGKAHTKQFREEREIPILLVLDQRHSMFFGSKLAMKSVMACDLFSLLAWSGLNNGDRVGGIIINDEQHHEIRPKKSRKNVLHLLDHANRANHALHAQLVTQAHDSQSMQDLLKEVKRLAKPGFQIFIISDFQDFDQDCLPLVRDISLHCDCIALQVYDNLERELATELKQNQQVHTGHGLQWLKAKNKKWQENYQSQFDTQKQFIKDGFGQFQIPVLPFEASEPPLDQLMQFFSLR